MRLNELMEIRKQGMRPDGDIVIPVLPDHFFIDKPKQAACLLQIPNTKKPDYRSLLGLNVRIMFYERLEDALNLAVEVAKYANDLYFVNLKDDTVIWVFRGGQICQRLH